MTKLVPPLEAGTLLGRQRLYGHTHRMASSRLTVVQAAAGFGKTSLLNQWQHALSADGHTPAWLTLEPSDQDPVRLLIYIAAALARTDADLGATLTKLIQTERYLSGEVMITSLVNLLGETDRPLFLLLDDVHVLESGAQATLGRLIERAPANLHFILATRTLLPLNLSKWRTQGQLFELDASDLRFTADEVAVFFRYSNCPELSAEHLSAIEERTEGWAAGLKLASILLNRENAQQPSLASFSGSHSAVADFFAEEVLAFQSVEIRDFLLLTAPLGRFCAELCAAVAESPDACQLINCIEASGLFLQRLDDQRQWYRYHHLFADFLQRRLHEQDPNAQTRVFSKASVWFQERGAFIEAIDYALKAGEHHQAAQILDACCLDMSYDGRIRLVAQFAERIPPALLNHYPTVLLSWAWLLTRNLDFEAARKLLGRVRNWLKGNESTQEHSAERLNELRNLLRHREMTLAAAEDKIALVEEHCQTLVDDRLTDTHPYLAGTIYAQLQYAQREQYKLSEVERLAAIAQGTLRRSGFNFALISVQSLVGPSLHALGNSDAAINALEEGLEEAIRYGGERSALSALPALPLAGILYERNELTRARQLLDDSLPVVSEFGFVDQLLAGYLTQSRMLQAAGDNEGARQALDSGMSVALDRGLERLRMFIVAERIKQLLDGQHFEQAAQYARSAGVPADGKAVQPRSGCTTKDEAQAIAWTRLAISQNRLVDALNVAKQWRSFCNGHNASRSLIGWNLLLAQLQLLSGEQRSALRSLREAIALAAPMRAIRCFIDEGPAIANLLANLHESPSQSQHPTDVFARELFELCKPPCDQLGTESDCEGLYGKLSKRELEILSLVGVGMRNREVAARLGMTEGSIKWYMQQVYDKVGTRRRLKAVEQVKKMGLIR
ncbi:LuxR C-terminal-related transcriptional regulator [Pseudomonas sp. LB3P14]